jgi:hypothetical protein
MLWTTLLTIYVILSYTVLGSFLLANRAEALIPSLGSLREASGFKKHFTRTALCLAFPLIGPFTFGFSLTGTRKDHPKHSKSLAMLWMHHDPVLEPIAQTQMHSSAQQLIAELETELEVLGFDVGDQYVLWKGPYRVETSFYLSDDGQSVAAIGHIDGEAFFSFTSILSCGAGVETSCSVTPIDLEPIKETEKFFGQTFAQDGNLEFVDVYSAHKELVSKLEQERSVIAMEMRRNQVRSVAEYASRKLSEALYETGQIDDASASPRWPFGFSSEQADSGVEIVLSLR